MTYLFILTHSLVLSKSYRKTVVQSMQPILFPELSILQIKKYSFLYSLSCRFSLPAARPSIWLFDYLSSPIFGLFYIVITQSALFPFDFGIELLEQCYTVSYFQSCGIYIPVLIMFYFHPDERLHNRVPYH